MKHPGDTIDYLPMNEDRRWTQAVGKLSLSTDKDLQDFIVSDTDDQRSEDMSAFYRKELKGHALSVSFYRSIAATTAVVTQGHASHAVSCGQIGKNWNWAQQQQSQQQQAFVHYRWS